MEIEVANDTDSCSSGGCGGGSGDVAGAAYLVWQDLTVVIPNTRDGRPRTILRGLTGLAEPGKITAVMGPSGSGKSTFLDSLADRLSANVVMTGNVLLNGKKMRRDRGLIAYVTQENILLGTLTVRETITYSAHLRFPSTLSNAEVDGIVEETIIAMGLQDCADRLVGNWHLRGVSGGEKKRLSIAIEILTRPQLLFLDEPTSGLDSAASFLVVQILRNLAMDGGRTIITSIHQPSSETFSLFDDLFLLSAGETVYFGGAKTAIEFFAEAGYPCPSRRSPSDHFLRCINSDFDKVTAVLMGKHDMQASSDPLINVETAQIKATLVEKYRWSEYAVRVRAKIQEIESIEGLPTETKRVSQATWWKQLSTLSRRSFKNMCRDVGYYWARLGVYIIVAVCVGTIFYHVGTTYAAISARGAYGAFMVGFMVFMSIGGFPSFVEELKVFNRERDGGYYGSGVYVLSNMLSSMPLLVLLTMASSSICYYMVEFRPEFSHFVYSCLMLFACISAVESSMMVVASLVSNYLLGLLIGAGVIVIMMMNSGNSRLLPDLHKPLRRYPISYISLGRWALQGWYKNDLLGLEFDTIDPGKPKLKGADIIRDLYGIRLDHSKWWDLAAVYMIFISYRIIFFLVLEFKQRTSLVFQKLNTKKAWHSLKKRPLFQMPAFPSKRYQPQQSLYSQGLSSPIS